MFSQTSLFKKILNKREIYLQFQYLRLARTLKHYGYMQFSPAITDYPHPDCRVIVSAGNKELNFRIQVSQVWNLYV